MTIRTASGQELESDFVVENPTPPRLYIDLKSLTEKQATILMQDGLPIDGYPEYTVLQNLYPVDGGIRVVLRKE